MKTYMFMDPFSTKVVEKVGVRWRYLACHICKTAQYMWKYPGRTGETTPNYDPEPSLWKKEFSGGTPLSSGGNHPLISLFVPFRNQLMLFQRYFDWIASLRSMSELEEYGTTLM